MTEDYSDPRNDLVAEALSLLTRTAELPESGRQRALDEWAARSADHAAALKMAQLEWALLGELEDAPLQPAQRLGLYAETVVASVTDHPGRLAAAFCALIALVFTPVLLNEVNTARETRNTIAQAQVHTSHHGQSATRYSTARGEQLEITLPNDSRLWLNWNTEVLVAELDGTTHVDVIIGDAMFYASKSDQRPLVVHAGQAFAHAPNAEFSIHSHGLHDAFFQVKRGKVTVHGEHNGAPRQIASSEEVYYLNGQGGDIRSASARSIGAWRDEKIIFDERPLEEVLYSLSHYTEQQITVGSLLNPNQKVTATYALQEADEALLQLANAYDLELYPQASNVLEVRSVDPRRL